MKLYKFNNNFIISCTIFITSLFIFLIGTYSQEFIQFNTRFGLFVKEISYNGINFFPTTYSEPYPDYPATAFILMYWLSLLFNKVNLLVAVIPSAIAASFTTVLIYQIGKLQSQKWGAYGFLFSLFTLGFIIKSRSISLDQFTCLFTALSFYLVYSADLAKQYKRLWFIPISLILSFSFRGPIGLVIPTAVMAVYYLLNKNYKNFIILGIVSFLLLILCSSLLLTGAFLQGGREFVRQVVSMEMMHGVIDTGVPIYYYWTNGLGFYAITLPFSFLVIIIHTKHFLKKNLEKQLKLLQYLAAWLLIILVGMTIPGGKKIRYILPIIPAISLLTAYIFISSQNNKWLNLLKFIILRISDYLPTIILTATLGIILYNLKVQNLNINNFLLATSLSLIAIIFAKFLLLKYISNTEIKHFIVIGVGAISFIVCNILTIETIKFALNNSSDFISKIEQIVKIQNRKIVFYQIGRDSLAIPFLVNSSYHINPDFVQSSYELPQNRNNNIYITRADRFNNNPKEIKSRVNILVRGRIGHKDSLAFIIN